LREIQRLTSYPVYVHYAKKGEKIPQNVKKQPAPEQTNNGFADTWTPPTRTVCKPEFD